jgi:hypothetical protein
MAIGFRGGSMIIPVIKGMMFFACSQAGASLPLKLRNEHEIRSSVDFYFPLWQRGLGGFLK